MNSAQEVQLSLASEQIVQIVAVACEQPASSGRPISHWTPRELAAELVKRGRSAGDFPT